VPAAAVDSVVEVFNVALTKSIYCRFRYVVFSIIGALTMEWKSVKARQVVESVLESQLLANLLKARVELDQPGPRKITVMNQLY
jgi:hypothetical protein